MKPTVTFACALLLAPGYVSAQAAKARAGSVYRVPISTWPKVQNENGYVGPDAGGYVLEAASNTWMGPGSKLPLNVVFAGDFTMSVSFSVVYREDCSLSLTLSDAGTDYSQLDFFLDLWQTGPPTYSAFEYWVQRNFYANLKRRFAERVQILNASTVDWRRANTLAIARQGNTMLLSLNGKPFGTFLAPVFPVRQLGVGIAFKSKILIGSITVGSSRT